MNSKAGDDSPSILFSEVPCCRLQTSHTAHLEIVVQVPFHSLVLILFS